MNKTLLLLTGALCAFPLVASADQYDLDKVTLSALTREADSVVEAEVVKVDGALRLRVSSVVSGAGAGAGVLVPGPRYSAITEGDRGLAFLTFGDDGKPNLTGGQFGWVPGDDRAAGFVGRLLSEPTRSFELLIEAVGDRSDRVRRDAIRALGVDFGARLLKASADQVNTLEVAAREDWDKGWPARAALRLLGLLPNEAGVPALVLASKMGVQPETVATALARHPKALNDLGVELRLRRGQLTASEVQNRIEVLGLSGSAIVVDDLLSLVNDAGLKGRAIKALARLGDARGLPTFKGALLQSDEDMAAWSAIGLSLIGGDQAIGALRFARNNHPSARVRGLVNGLMKNPVKTRREFGQRGWAGITVGGPRRELTPVGKPNIEGKRLTFTPKKDG